MIQTVTVVALEVLPSLPVTIYGHWQARARILVAGNG